MEFEDIQKSWQAQKVQVNADDKILNVKKNNWERNQRKLLKSNVCMSLGFVAAMVGIGWVYLAYHNQYGLPFKVSIVCMYILMIVFSVISWRSYHFRIKNTDDSSQEYIQRQLKKLRWQRTVIKKYIFIYVILLWMTLVMYIWEITISATPTFRFIAFGLTTIYIFGITMWNKVKKQKKQLEEINSLIVGLEDIKRRLDKV